MNRENVIRHIREEIENAKFQKIYYASVSIDVLSDSCELLKKQEHKDRMYHALEDDWKRLNGMLKEQDAVEPFHKCIGNEFSLVEDSHFDYCPYCGKLITWAKQEGR